MNKQLNLQIKQQYGQEVLIPVGHDAELFCQIAGTKTMTRQTLKLVKQLGYTISIEQPKHAFQEFV